MRSFRSLTAGPLGLAAAAALAVGLTFAGPALVAPAAAAEKAGSASIANDTLTIVGTNGPDVVALNADATQARVTFGDDPANVHQFSLSDFTTISVSLGNGDDQFTEQQGVLANTPLTVAGDNGTDSITTGDGVDVIDGGNGNDRVDAGRGNDNVFLGNGKDFFVWNPGQGSDAVDGGNGNDDVMQFNGADGNEIMSLSADGSRAVFLRNVGSIRMDMNDIEILNLAALGGIDNVTIDDLEGTSIRHANIDLSATGGGADHAADVVTVNGTNQADRVAVTAQGGLIDVAGLQADTQITGEETLDHLQVNTLDGNDRVNVDPNVATIIGVAVDLGLGQL
jgi:hemolysin type calcium-binding protein